MLNFFISPASKYMNIQKNKLHDLAQIWGKGVGIIRYQNAEILKFVPSRLVESLT